MTAGGGAGSGFIFAVEGTTAFVITNHHVIEDDNSIDVRVDDSRTFRATLLGFDEKKDLAVMAVCCSEHFVALLWESEVPPAIGVQVVAVGYARASSNKVTSTIGRVTSNQPIDSTQIIWHDAPLNPGNSGGPLFSMNATVLGLNVGESTLNPGIFGAVSYQSIREQLPDWKARLIVTESTPVPIPGPLIGETVTAEGSSYIVNEVRDPAPERQSRNADEGNRLVAVDITQSGLEEGDSYGESDFSVQDADGYVYERSYNYADLKPQFGSGNLSTGQKVRGWVTFEVSDTAVLVSVLAKPSWSVPRVIIADLTANQ